MLHPSLVDSEEINSEFKFPAPSEAKSLQIQKYGSSEFKASL
jgi:hypothetical protein